MLGGNKCKMKLKAVSFLLTPEARFHVSVHLFDYAVCMVVRILVPSCMCALLSHCDMIMA